MSNNIHSWDVPSVCTGVWYDFGEGVTVKEAIDLFSRQLTWRLDFALHFMAVPDNDPNANVLHTIHRDILGMNEMRMNGVTIYSATPCEVCKALDMFFASEKSEEYGYNNYKFLSGEYKEKDNTVAKTNHDYVLGSDSHHGRNTLGLFEGSLDDYYDDEDDGW